jgi:sterol carrier protein 2
MTQIPLVNVNNNCSTGSTAIYLARQAIEGGLYDCAMAMGFEKMFTGSLKSFFTDRTNPGDWRRTLMEERRGIDPKAPPASQTFGNAAIEYMERYGATTVHLDKIAQKNHAHSGANPYSSVPGSKVWNDRC